MTWEQIVLIAICALSLLGVIFNLWLKMDVWDYSYMPFHILGQICPMFTLMWAGLAIVFLPFADALNNDFA